MKRILAAAAVVAAILGQGSPALADVPTAGQLEKGLLTQSDLPKPYEIAFPAVPVETSLGESTPRCPEPAVPDGPTVNTTNEFFLDTDGSMITMTIIATGAGAARDAVKDAAAIPGRCPVFEKGNTSFTTKAFPLAEFGDASTAFDMSVKEGKDSPVRVVVAVVAAGDVCALFALTPNEENDEAEFRTIVTAGVKKLALIKH
ncbi:hypothetical protein [Actinoplanes sp. GCM10030250]|uniref:hypothetical protein n=1 Tax=Actinoplanes sp. GCM10030250 TaxID=3273376 RepID=UPI00361807DC